MRRICVFTGSHSGRKPAYRCAAIELGRALAARGIDLVYGGASVGLMGAVADSALEAGGHVIGVIPHAIVAREVAHPGLPDLRVVASMHERKALMADLSDGFLAMPGGWGTFEELFEVLTWSQLGLHQKPCGLLNVDGYFDPLIAMLRHAVDEGFLRADSVASLPVASGVNDLLDLFAAYQPPFTERWIDSRSR